MSDPITGISMTVSVNTGTAGSPVWTEVGGQRNATLNRGAQEINASDKTTNGWERVLAGLRNWSIEADGLYIYDDSGFAELEDAFMASGDGPEKVQISIITPAGTRYQGYAYITDFPISAPYDDVASYSVTFSGAGALSNS